MSDTAETVSSLEEKYPEIRGQKTSKGGLAYDVILAMPVVSAPKGSITPTCKETIPVTAEEIVSKLQAAENKRRLTEKSKIAFLEAKLCKMEAASCERYQANTRFISMTRGLLEQRIGTHMDNRINEVCAKLQEHFDAVERTQSVMYEQTAEIKSAVEEKLSTSAAKRDDNMNKMLQRLKDHASVRAGLQEKNTSLEQQIKCKLDLAESRRQHLEEERKEKLSERERRAEKVRQNKKRMSAAKADQQNTSG